MILSEHNVFFVVVILVLFFSLIFFSSSDDEKKSDRLAVKDAENFQRSLTEAISKPDIPEPSRVIRIGRDDILALLEVIEDIKNFNKPLNFSVEINNKVFEVIMEDRDEDSDGKKQ